MWLRGDGELAMVCVHVSIGTWGVFYGRERKWVAAGRRRLSRGKNRDWDGILGLAFIYIPYLLT